jgi:addiction module HigA family antidote
LIREKIMPMFNPPHPGEVIRTEIVEGHDLTVTAAAKALGVSRQALSGLLNGQAGLTGDMALRIEKAFGPKMDTLMGMQSAYDIFQARQRARTIKLRPYRAAQIGRRPEGSPSRSAQTRGLRVAR